MTESERIALVSDCIQFLANMWVRWLRPVPIDRTFNVGGIRVRVIVDESKDDTKPLGGKSSEQMADRSKDA